MKVGFSENIKQNILSSKPQDKAECTYLNQAFQWNTFFCNKYGIQQQNQLILSHISFNSSVKYRGRRRKYSKKGFQS